MKVSGYIAACKAMGIETLPPDINSSCDNFTVEGDCIRFGMGAVKNVGRSLIRSMVAKREEGGPFKSLEDFVQRMGEGELNKRAVENFIKCGAMDCFGHHRSSLLAVYDLVMDSVSAARRKNVAGQMGLFSMLEGTDTAASIEIPELDELSPGDRMLMEKETTGIYLSGHPMDDYRAYLKNTHVVPIATLMGEDCPYQDDQIVSVAGVIQAVKMKTTRNNSVMAYVTLEDDTASIEMLAFSNVISQYGNYLKENVAVVIVGRFSVRDDKDPQIVVNRARPISDFAEGKPIEDENVQAQVLESATLYLRLPSEEGALFGKVKAILNMFPGKSNTVVYFADTKQRRGTKCNLDKRMLRELNQVLGAENVVIK